MTFLINFNKISNFQNAADENEIEVIYCLLQKEKEIKREFFGCNTQLKKIVIPSSVITIEDYAFCKCSSLKQIVIPSSVTSIGNYAFFKCSSLTQISIPSSLNSIPKNAFEGCSSLS